MVRLKCTETIYEQQEGRKLSSSIGCIRFKTVCVDSDKVLFRKGKVYTATRVPRKGYQITSEQRKSVLISEDLVGDSKDAIFNIAD